VADLLGAKEGLQRFELESASWARAEWARSTWPRAPAGSDQGNSRGTALLRPEYAAGQVGLTRTAAQPLTPEYGSPEQIHGQPVTTASDIYSLGVLLYTKSRCGAGQGPKIRAKPVARDALQQRSVHPM
jgi:serine/threonine protein kinase